MDNQSYPLDLSLLSRLNDENLEEISQATHPFRMLMMKYDCALKEVKTKFEVLSSEFSILYDYSPVENIKTRIKKPLSIINKLKDKNLPVSIESIEKNINDIAGIRIICSFIDDIYTLADTFLRQDDITLLEIRDYIKSPKDSGYRSLHLIVEVPVFFTDKTEIVKVEVQLRTIAMDFWASLEHKTQYKKDIKDPTLIYDELKNCAHHISSIDERMQHLHKIIKNSED